MTPEYKTNSYSGYIFMAMNKESKCLNILSLVINEGLSTYTFLPYKGEDKIDPTTTVVYWRNDTKNLIDFINYSRNAGIALIDPKYEDLISTEELLFFKVTVNVKDTIKTIILEDA